MRRDVLVALTFCGTLLMPVSMANADPVMNISNHPIPNVNKLSLDQVRQAIIAGGTRYKWVFEDQGPGSLKASQFGGRFQAVINITFTESSYNITLLQSEGLEQKGDQIRSRYNRWVQLLTRSIDAKLR